jgi:hypothetical protein
MQFRLITVVNLECDTELCVDKMDGGAAADDSRDGFTMRDDMYLFVGSCMSDAFVRTVSTYCIVHFVIIMIGRRTRGIAAWKAQE